MLLMNASPSVSKPSRGNTAFPSTYDKQIAWKQHQQRKNIDKIQAQLTEEERVCTFSPKTNHQRSNEQCNKASVQDKASKQQGDMSKNLQTLSDISMAAIEREGVDCTGDHIADKSLNEMPNLMPTETQTVSIQRHLARQERARDFARQALRKLYAGRSAKNHPKPDESMLVEQTAIENRQKRSASEPPKGDRPLFTKTSAHQSSYIGNVSRSPEPESKGSDHLDSSSKYFHQTSNAHPTETRDYGREISKMLTIIEKQRQELDHRDDARQQALKVADTFADAIRQFEERLHSIETKTANDVSEIRQLLQRQASVSEQILLSLNLPSRPSQLVEEAVVSPSKR